MRKVGLVGLLGLATVFGSLTPGRNSNESYARALHAEVRRPLDLPSGGRGDDEDEEDAPETIRFYNQMYEGDGFTWVLDTSGSMDGGKLGVLKGEVVSALEQLSDESDIALIRFSSGYTMFRPHPVEATLGNRAQATQWVYTLQAGGETCIGPAGVAGVGLSNMSSKDHKIIIVVSDGEPYGGGQDTSATSLANITSANYQHTPINTIGIEVDSAGQSFLQTLASMNNGTYSSANGN